MKYVVRMLVPKEQIIVAGDLGQADQEARRLQAMGNDSDGVSTTVLLSVTRAKIQD